MYPYDSQPSLAEARQALGYPPRRSVEIQEFSNEEDAPSLGAMFEETEQEYENSQELSSKPGTEPDTKNSGLFVRSTAHDDMHGDAGRARHNSGEHTNSPGGHHGHGNEHGRHLPGHANNSHRGRPPGTPPGRIPEEHHGAARDMSPQAIRPCLNSFTYIRLTNGPQFWMYPTFVGRNSIAGYKWGRFGWSFTGFDLRGVRSFSC